MNVFIDAYKGDIHRNVTVTNYPTPSNAIGLMGRRSTGERGMEIALINITILVLILLYLVKRIQIAWRSILKYDNIRRLRISSKWNIAIVNLIKNYNSTGGVNAKRVKALKIITKARKEKIIYDYFMRIKMEYLKVLKATLVPLIDSYSYSTSLMNDL